MQHVDIVFDGPPGHEAGRFIEVEDGAGNSIKLGEWIETDKGGPIAGSAVAYVKPTWVLRIEDPRELRRQVDAVWELLDHRVDGQPFWSDRSANGGGETMDIGMAVAFVLRHYRDQITAWQDAWGSAHSRETCTPDKLARWVAAVNEQRESQSKAIDGLENEAVHLRKRCAEQERSITKLCEENERRGRDLETARKEYENALTARDAVWRELQAIREATMLEPAGGDWTKIDAEHLRQHVQDMGDQIARLTRQRDQVAAETLEWTKAAHHLDHTIIAPPQLKLAAERVSNELASARVDRDGWKTAARTLGSMIEQPGELVAAIDSLRDSMKVTGQLCADNTALTGKLEAQRNEIATLRRHLDAIGMMLIPQRGSQTFTRLPHEIEEAARQHAQNRDACVELAKVLGIQNANPQYLIAKVTDLHDLVEARSKQLDAQLAIVARFRRALVIGTAPKLDAAAELEEIRTVVLAALKRAEMTPIEPLRSLAAELADAFTRAARDRDKAQTELEEMAQEMARGVHPEDVAEAVERAQTLDEDEDDEITIGLDDACDILSDVLIDHVAESAIEGIVAEFRSRWDDDDSADDQPAEVKLSDDQIDTIVDKLAERLAATGSRVRLIKPR